MPAIFRPAQCAQTEVVYSRRTILLHSGIGSGEKFQIESSLLTTRKSAFRLISTGKLLVSRTVSVIH
ncbi:MAG TPA: hypothetical protein VJS64_03765 [Pyrinomonadaceae bacterium]|nr:hypothetical protein [Pyrinomonadaceae bacterium]